jgi:hypothetical protein
MNSIMALAINAWGSMGSIVGVGRFNELLDLGMF